MENTRGMFVKLIQELSKGERQELLEALVKLIEAKDKNKTEIKIDCY